MPVKVEVVIDANMNSVWDAWVSPEDIKAWNAASDDWHTTVTEIDLREGGTFLYRMEAKDSSMGFDFTGVFQKIIEHQRIEFVLDDGRQVNIAFKPVEDGIKVTEYFDAESENSIDTQRKGWQSILDNFASYVEAEQ